ncbi:MAG: hypothetical protein A2Y62_02365 [Candidatus Fischerbacteria bacterium RBG_13_37_8]|uniref:Uncharacterized protein n=1 Tax=Candidatus Fischerbacteria bacterium RBG_13_37_8 TaxID=1817863 RepID=A0A1F5VXT2_9BACT|nr:MAG: hypothetical protein A2Y62_02365 [Candidatus Fischerbacteria bacterium RBG_13_37_8]
MAKCDVRLPQPALPGNYQAAANYLQRSEKSRRMPRFFGKSYGEKESVPSSVAFAFTEDRKFTELPGPETKPVAFILIDEDEPHGFDTGCFIDYLFDSEQLALPTVPARIGGIF